MGLFDAFRKQTPTEQLRKEVAKYFNKIIEDSIRDAAGDFSAAVKMIEVNTIKLYLELEQSQQLASICAQEGINYKVLLKEELQRARKKYLRNA